MFSVNVKINTTLTNKPQHQALIKIESSHLFFIDVKYQYIINTKAQHQ